MRDDTETLASLRARIDELDAGIHALLLERGKVIDELVAAKQAGTSGPAFRPDREAAMMSALRVRHRGTLPFLSVVNIWRVIVSTFTQMQAPFSVHVGGNDPELRDLARLQFGFSTPLVAASDAEGALQGVADARGDLALIAVQDKDHWWTGVQAQDLKVIAVLPDIEEAAEFPRAVVLADARIDTSALPLTVCAAVASGTNDFADEDTGVGPDILAVSGKHALMVMDRDAVKGVAERFKENGIVLTDIGASSAMNRSGAS